MAHWQQLKQILRANIQHWLTRREDPEKTLEGLIAELDEQFAYLRQVVAAAIATQKRLNRQADQAERLAEDWYHRAEVAIRQNREELAREALTRRQSYQNSSAALNTQRQTQQLLITQLKQQLAFLETRVFEIKTQKDLWVARARTAETTEKLYSVLNSVGTRATLGAFERMEEKVLDLEARAEAIASLSSQQLEQQLDALGQADAVDAELLRLKHQIQEPV